MSPLCNSSCVLRVPPKKLTISQTEQRGWVQELARAARGSCVEDESCIHAAVYLSQVTLHMQWPHV